MQIDLSSNFRKAFRKRVEKNKQLSEVFKIKLETFIDDPFHPSLSTHKLSGKLGGLYSFTVAYDCRVIFEFIDNQSVLFIDIGKHDEVY